MILQELNSLYLLNKSSLNWGIVSVGTGVIISALKNFCPFIISIINPPTKYVFPDLGLHPHKNILLPDEICFNVLSIINF